MALTSKSVRTGAVVVQVAGLVVALLVAPCALADGPPLPIHSIAGTGGVFATHNAYLVNPAEEGKVFGLPSVGILHVYLGQGKSLESFTITETLWNRLELGYAFNYIDFGDLPQDIERMTGVELGDQYAGLHHFNARVALVRDGEFDMPWLPAVTAGVHYKYNDTINDIDDDLVVRSAQSPLHRPDREKARLVRDDEVDVVEPESSRDHGLSDDRREKLEGESHQLGSVHVE